MKLKFKTQDFLHVRFGNTGCAQYNGGIQANRFTIIYMSAIKAAICLRVLI